MRAELGGLTPMSFWRYTNDPALNFPVLIKIGKRNFRSRKAVEAFKQRLIAEATGRRANAAEQTAG